MFSQECSYQELSVFLIDQESYFEDDDENMHATDLR